MSRVQCYKTFYVRNLRIFVINYCLSLASISRLVLMFASKAGASPRVKYLSKGKLQGRLLGFVNTSSQTGESCERQHSSLLRTFVNYGSKEFYNNGPRFLSYNFFLCNAFIHSVLLDSEPYLQILDQRVCLLGTNTLSYLS